MCSSLLVTAQHSKPYRNMGRMQVLYSFSLLENGDGDSRLPDMIVNQIIAAGLTNTSQRIIERSYDQCRSVRSSSSCVLDVLRSRPC